MGGAPFVIIVCLFFKSVELWGFSEAFQSMLVLLGLEYLYLVSAHFYN